MLTVSTGKGLEGEDALLLSRPGTTVRAAMDAVQNYASSEDLFYAHTRYILIGEDAACAGIEQLLDCVQRSSQFRLSTAMVVVRTSTAKDMIQASGSGSYDITETLDATRRDVELHGASEMISCGDLARDLAERDAGLICAVRPAPLEGSLLSGENKISNPNSGGEAGPDTENSQDQQAQSGEQNASTPSTILPAGYGVIVGDQVVAWLEQNAARGVNILRQRAGSGTIVVDTGQTGLVTLLIDGCACDYTPVFAPDGSLHTIAVDVQLKTAILELSDPDTAFTDEFIDSLQQQLSREVGLWVGAPLQLEQQLQADFLGIGPTLRKKAPDWFSEHDWTAELDHVSFSPSVSVLVERSYGPQKGVDRA